MINQPPPSGAEPAVTLDNISGTDIPITFTQIKHLASLIEEHEQITFHLLEFVFVDPDEIERINAKYLDHHYVTDVITFVYDDEATEHIEATIYGCAQQIFHQASSYEISPLEEFYRIVIHGMLHLAGYDDVNEQSTLKMREREQFYLEEVLPG